MAKRKRRKKKKTNEVPVRQEVVVHGEKNCCAIEMLDDRGSALYTCKADPDVTNYNFLMTIEAVTDVFVPQHIPGLPPHVDPQLVLHVTENEAEDMGRLKMGNVYYDKDQAHNIFAFVRGAKLKGQEPHPAFYCDECYDALKEAYNNEEPQESIKGCGECWAEPEEEFPLSGDEGEDNGGLLE